MIIQGILYRGLGVSTSAIAAVAMASSFVAPAQATVPADRSIATARLQPVWARGGASSLRPNDSFISSTSCAPSDDPSILSQENYFTAKDAATLRQRYEDMNRDYQFRATYNINGHGVDRAHADQMTSFGQEIIAELRKQQLNRGRQKINDIAQRDENLRKAAGPIAVAGTILAIYSNEPFNIPLTDDSKIVAHTNVSAQSGGVSLFSPVMNGSVELDNRAAERNPLDPPPLDPTQTKEKYRVSLSRGLGILDLTSGLSYGGTSSMLSASVSKPITDHLTCVVDTVRPLDAATYVARGSEERVKFLFGVSF